MSDVSCPVHGVDFGKMAAEVSTGPHDDSGEWFDVPALVSDCRTGRRGSVKGTTGEVAVNVRLPSLRDSRWVRIFSFRPSASRRAAASLSASSLADVGGLDMAG